MVLYITACEKGGNDMSKGLFNELINFDSMCFSDKKNHPYTLLREYIYKAYCSKLYKKSIHDVLGCRLDVLVSDIELKIKKLCDLNDVFFPSINMEEFYENEKENLVFYCKQLSLLKDERFIQKMENNILNDIMASYKFDRRVNELREFFDNECKNILSGVVFNGVSLVDPDTDIVNTSYIRESNKYFSSKDFHLLRHIGNTYNSFMKECSVKSYLNETDKYKREICVFYAYNFILSNIKNIKVDIINSLDGEKKGSVKYLDKKGVLIFENDEVVDINIDNYIMSNLINSNISLSLYGKLNILNYLENQFSFIKENYDDINVDKNMINNIISHIPATGLDWLRNELNDNIECRKSINIDLICERFVGGFRKSKQEVSSNIVNLENEIIALKNSFSANVKDIINSPLSKNVAYLWINDSSILSLTNAFYIIELLDSLNNDDYEDEELINYLSSIDKYYITSVNDYVSRHVNKFLNNKDIIKVLRRSDSHGKI